MQFMIVINEWQDPNMSVLFFIGVSRAVAKLLGITSDDWLPAHNAVYARI